MPTTLVDRLKDRIGPAASTMVAEDDDRRHFLGELTITAVAVYLAMKYIDGFIDGSGVDGLGRRHGEAVKRTTGELAGFIRRIKVIPRDDAERELDGHLTTLSTMTAEIRPHGENAAARRAGAEAARALLSERGVPPSTAQRIAQDIDTTLCEG